MKNFHIGNRLIGRLQPCYIIAEIGVNHNGKEALVIKLIEEAAKAGADAVKFSTFNTCKLLTESDKGSICIDDTCGYGESTLDMYKRLELPDTTLRKAVELCKKLNIGLLFTPFDEDSVDAVTKLGVPAIKIASGDLTDDPFLKYVAKQKRPVILSTGMSTLEEVKHAVKVLLENACPELALLHCVSNYPAKANELNLRVLATLAREFEIPIGFSDHTIGIEAAPAAVAAGACIIEKHFTLNKELPGPDHKLSVDPYELFQMIKEIRRVEIMLGVEQKQPTANELEFRKFGRRSIVARFPIEPGVVIAESMLAMKRPGTGISPRDLYKVVGRTARVRIRENEILTWDKLS